MTLQIWLKACNPHIGRAPDASARLENQDTDMSEALSLRFQRSNGMPFEIDGQLVRQIVRIEVPAAKQNFVIRRIRSKEQPISGLRLKAANGNIEVNGQRQPGIILWTDTSPESVEISVISKSGCELKAWNVWKTEGVVQAWVGNSGFIVTEEKETIRFECSDGSGEADFSDFVVELHTCNF
jgi:hypothetical protein